MKAILTGASGGIGEQIFFSLSARGYDVACCSRHQSDALQAHIEDTNRQGANHVWVDLDLASEDSIGECLSALEQWSQRKVDALINCAGTAHGGLVNMTKMEDIKRVFQVNFFGHIMLTQKVSRFIAKNGGGRIVNIASNAGLRADKGTLAYGSSKAALIHATRIMAAEYAAQNIAVNAIAPSIVATDMASEMDPKVSQRIMDMSSIQRMIGVDEVVAMVAFLLHDAPIALTGEVMKIDGCMAL